jgi:hypothetical protein
MGQPSMVRKKIFPHLPRRLEKLILLLPWGLRKITHIEPGTPLLK